MPRRAERIDKRLQHVVGQQLKRDLQRAELLTVALSGGIDSIVLLEILRVLASEMGFGLEALHVNHGLSPNADQWQKFCKMHCARRKIPFCAVKVCVQGAGSNLEAQARSARYAAFAEHGSEVIALGHHLDDQAETVLLQLLRGSGIRGLSAMPTERESATTVGETSAAAIRKPMRILRPLLTLTRGEIEQYARYQRLHWIEDESNTEERFARNFLRKRILPTLEQHFPGCRRRLTRSSLHLAEAGRLLDELAAIDAQPIVDGARLRVAGLCSLDHARATNLLRYFLHSRAIAAPSTNHLNEVLRQLCVSRCDAEPQLRVGAVWLRRFRGWIELVAQPSAEQRTCVVTWSGEARLALPGGGELRAQATRGRGVSAAKLASGVVSVRWRRGGERMRLDERRPRRTLKNLLQELAIPPWQRAALPLLYLNDRLVWAACVGVDCEFRAKPGERALLFTWAALPSPACDGRE